MNESSHLSAETKFDYPTVVACETLELILGQGALQIASVNGVSIIPTEKMSLPSGATIELVSATTLIYDPNGAFTGMTTRQSKVDRFEFQLKGDDGQLIGKEQYVSIQGDNEPPLAEDDFVKSTVNSKVTFTVLDSTRNHDSLIVSLLNEPAFGNASVNDDGTITFVPQPEWTGTVDIHYSVEDNKGTLNDATLTIEVEPEYFAFPFGNVSARQTSKFTTPRAVSRKVKTLNLHPIFTGDARPGTEILAQIMDMNDVTIDHGYAQADEQGKWQIQFNYVRNNEFYRVVFEPVPYEGIDIYGFLMLEESSSYYCTVQ